MSLSLSDMSPVLFFPGFISRFYFPPVFFPRKVLEVNEGYHGDTMLNNINTIISVAVFVPNIVASTELAEEPAVKILELGSSSAGLGSGRNGRDPTQTQSLFRPLDLDEAKKFHLAMTSGAAPFVMLGQPVKIGKE